eukprot:GHUV01040211.1.p1 GENE.GHUV01040211.1~~GHUV01040211.1.p1  ORF type:complete len:275 (+),score=50.08 GHUV01040211.1:82-906(+)
MQLTLCAHLGPAVFSHGLRRTTARYQQLLVSLGQQVHCCIGQPIVWLTRTQGEFLQYITCKLQPQAYLSGVLLQGSSYFSWLLKWQFRRSTPITIPILQTAHEDLKPEGSIPEFRQHLSMAITTVLQLYSQADWQGLKPMISAGLLESMQSAYDTQTEAAQSQGLSLQDVNLDIHKLDIVCAHAITAEQLSAIDEWRSREEAVGAKSNSSHKANSMWDVVYVHVESTWSATLQTSAGSEKYSRPKSGYWVFCRGPVQFDDVVPADLPWFVLAWL